MILCACMVQEGQISEQQMQSLEAGLNGITSEFFDQPAAPLWTTVARGDGWTAGEPSTTSLVVMYVPPGMDQPTRTRLLEAVCDTWSAVTGCSINEIVATARDTEQ